MVPKLILLFTTAGWSAQPYSINFVIYIVMPSRLLQLSKLYSVNLVGWLDHSRHSGCPCCLEARVFVPLCHFFGGGPVSLTRKLVACSTGEIVGTSEHPSTFSHLDKLSLDATNYPTLCCCAPQNYDLDFFQFGDTISLCVWFQKVHPSDDPL